MNTIEMLKKNEKPFGLMTDKMQAKASELSDDLQKFCSYGWEKLHCPTAYKAKFVTYRLRPDYEEKAETVECEVKVYKQYGNSLRFKEPNGLAPYELYMAFAYPDFIGFKYDGIKDPIPDTRRYKDKDGHTWGHYKEGYEVLTPTHVLFRSKT